MTGKKYILRFCRQDCLYDEEYTYSGRREALEHFRLFYEPESEELYTQITVTEYDPGTGEKKRLATLSFKERTPEGRVIRKNWRNWKIGRPTIYETHEFDGDCSFKGTITKIEDDHALMEADGMRLWIDDDTQYMFY